MHGEYKTEGGKLVVVDLDVRDGRLAGVRVSGDFFLEPPDALGAIVAALEGAPAELGEEELAARMRDALPSDAELVGFSPEAVARAIDRART